LERPVIGFEADITFRPEKLISESRVRGAAGEALNRVAEYVRDKARENIRSKMPGAGGNEDGFTDRLRVVDVDESALTALVATDHPGGRAQELGADIVPVKGKALRFFLPDGELVFAKEVHLPPRPYLGPAVEASSGFVRDEQIGVLERARTI